MGGLDLRCSKCGKPEKSKYKPAPNITFTCSTCIQNMMIKEALAKEGNNQIKRPIREKRE